MNSQELRSNLNQFFGSMNLYKQPDFMGGMKYSEGVNFFAENAGNGAFWFLDIISTEVHGKHPEAFLTLAVKDDRADITATDGNDTQIYDRAIEYTDAPDGLWQFWYMNDTLILPSEY